MAAPADIVDSDAYVSAYYAADADLDASFHVRTDRGADSRALTHSISADKCANAGSDVSANSWPDAGANSRTHASTDFRANASANLGAHACPFSRTCPAAVARAACRSDSGLVGQRSCRHLDRAA